jgi:sphinganine-1-phosphate aldolase
MKFESEIINMTASLVGLDDERTKDVCGCTSSGGTESIILAIKAHRDFYREKHGMVRVQG